MYVNISKFHVMQEKLERTAKTTQKQVKVQSRVTLFMLCNDEERLKRLIIFANAGLPV